ncbi:MAG: hypothetical protein ACT6RU_14445 [Aliihoeflea sp.]|uniref:hypothetical protein n=1 Tax=Aliihoeflea sp. TaxID=2608088 RepID=UPI004034E0DB
MRSVMLAGAELEDQAEVRVTLRQGANQPPAEHVGTVIIIAEMAFVRIRSTAIIPPVEGPLDESEVLQVEILQSRESVFAERHERARGPAVLGRPPQTREGMFQALYSLALAAAAETDARRRRQIKQQFDDQADGIMLAKAKRRWILADASCRFHVGRPFDPADVDDLVQRQKFECPLQLDFDPDPVVRRDRRAREAERYQDPQLRRLRSDLSRLRRAGLDVSWPRNAQYLLVHFGVEKRSKPARFIWQPGPDGGAAVDAEANTPTAAARVAKARRLAGYRLLRQLARAPAAAGSMTQLDLFVRP